ncbi:MAG: hypothetical protein BJ554DRAFT_7075, partial [Olpidium bornovanus]
ADEEEATAPTKASAFICGDSHAGAPSFLASGERNLGEARAEKRTSASRAGGAHTKLPKQPKAESVEREGAERQAGGADSLAKLPGAGPRALPRPAPSRICISFVQIPQHNADVQWQSSVAQQPSRDRLSPPPQHVGVLWRASFAQPPSFAQRLLSATAFTQLGSFAKPPRRNPDVPSQLHIS